MTEMQTLALQYVRERAAAGELSPATLPTVKWTLRDFGYFVSEIPLPELRARHVEEYLASISVAQSTARQRFCTIRQFSRWLVRRGHMAADITADLRAPRQPRAVPRGYRRNIVDGLLAVAPDARARLIILLEVQEGLRACEVARLELGDIDGDERTVLVHGKGCRERLLPISGQTWEALEAYLAERGVKSGRLIRSYNEPWKGISAAHIQHLVQGWLRLNDEKGYPCPKDGSVLTIMEGGAWCPKCHTVWREIGEVDLADLDALPIRDVEDGTP